MLKPHLTGKDSASYYAATLAFIAFAAEPERRHSTWGSFARE